MAPTFCAGSTASQPGGALTMPARERLYSEDIMGRPVLVTQLVCPHDSGRVFPFREGLMCWECQCIWHEDGSFKEASGFCCGHWRTEDNLTSVLTREIRSPLYPRRGGIA